jgi:hypothetical protein
MSANPRSIVADHSTAMLSTLLLRFWAETILCEIDVRGVELWS